MKRLQLWFVLALSAALCLLCACRAAEAAAPEELPAAPIASALAEDESEAEAAPDGLVREADGRVRYYENGAPAELQPGVQELGGKAYYVRADGGICDYQRCAAVMDDGNRYYFEDDCSLRSFPAGFAGLPDGVYYAEADGYALAGFSSGLAALDGALYAFDEDGRVMTFAAGAQEVFGKTYLVEEDGSAIALHEPGLLLRESGLYLVQDDGSLAVNVSEGYLRFGADGRYTSGNETLDAAVDALLLASGGVDTADPEESFRAAYSYLRDNYTYLSMDHQQPGTTDWEEDCALTFFDLGKGNCYCWAAAVSYCARRLGYQAYVVAGWESNPTNDHAWTMVDWPDGETYLFDAQLEYAYWYMFENKPKVDMFKASGDGMYYNGFAYYFP